MGVAVKKKGKGFSQRKGGGEKGKPIRRRRKKFSFGD